MSQNAQPSEVGNPDAPIATGPMEFDAKRFIEAQRAAGNTIEVQQTPGGPRLVIGAPDGLNPLPAEVEKGFGAQRRADPAYIWRVVDELSRERGLFEAFHAAAARYDARLASFGDEDPPEDDAALRAAREAAASLVIPLLQKPATNARELAMKVEVLAWMRGDSLESARANSQAAFARGEASDQDAVDAIVADILAAREIGGFDPVSPDALRLGAALDAALADAEPHHAEVVAAEKECWALDRSLDSDPTDRLRAAEERQRAAVAAVDAVIAEIAALPPGGLDVLRLKARAAYECRGSDESDAIAGAIVAELARKAA